MPPSKKALGPRLPADDENWYINVDGFLGRNWDDILTNTKEVRFVRTFQETLACLSYAGVGDVNFWVVDGDPKIHESNVAAFQAWKDVKDLWACIYVTSFKEDAETYTYQFDTPDEDILESSFLRDLESLLHKVTGDVELAATRFREGHAEQWGAVMCKKRQEGHLCLKGLVFTRPLLTRVAAPAPIPTNGHSVAVPALRHHPPATDKAPDSANTWATESSCLILQPSPPMAHTPTPSHSLNLGQYHHRLRLAVPQTKFIKTPATSKMSWAQVARFPDSFRQRLSFKDLHVVAAWTSRQRDRASVN
ncbi:hypothetical protein B0H14DRAFT_3573022 [Mycena olivaceomarginata]|nr:hypothetical protein B0H14DRAFT_3573022 [Mycena olivaceomarginata]